MYSKYCENDHFQVCVAGTGSGTSLICSGAHDGLQADLHFVFYDLHFEQTILGSCVVCESTSNNMGRSQLSVDELRNARQETQSAYPSDIHPNHCEKSAAGYILCSLYSALSGLTPYVGHILRLHT